MNKILNGDFSDGFNHWNNGDYGYPYTLDSGRAKGSSASGTTNEKIYGMIQGFDVNDEAISAHITVWGKWSAFSGSPDGYNNFRIRLRKPNASEVTLLDTTKTATVGSGNLLDNQDISANFDQYGNYEIWVVLKTASAYQWSERLQQYIYALSYGYYDNISINIAVKKYKSVHEKMGGSGASSTHASHQYKSVAEASGLSERYNFKVCKTVAEAIGLSESYETDVKEAQFKAVAESMGLVEAYSIQKTLHRSAAEAMGLSETLQAKRTQGNLETTYTIDELTQWSEISRMTTPWVKITKVIP